MQREPLVFAYDCTGSSKIRRSGNGARWSSKLRGRKRFRRAMGQWLRGLGIHLRPLLRSFQPIPEADTKNQRHEQGRSHHYRRRVRIPLDRDKAVGQLFQLEDFRRRIYAIKNVRQSGTSRMAKCRWRVVETLMCGCKASKRHIASPDTGLIGNQ